MSVPEGISHKLRRASHHLEALDVEVKAFLKTDPKPYRILSHDDPDSRDRIYRMEILKPPPTLDWAIVTGEILYNLVSALDHLAWELCLAHTPGKTPPARTEFPIFWDEDRFDDVKPGGGRYKIRGISWEMQSAIRDLQPYQRGHPPKSQSLWLLKEMSNVDKHRHLRFTIFGDPAVASFEDPNVEIIPFSVNPEDRLEVARARPVTPDAEVKNDPVFIPQIIFDEAKPGSRRPFIAQLGTFLRIVTEITEDLSNRFLPR